jgi:hypothetical protein
MVCGGRKNQKTFIIGALCAPMTPGVILPKGF